MRLRSALLGAGLSLALAAPAHADQVIPDDQIVQGDQCVGLDCINGEAFGSDTLRLKENNTRLAFDDTSTAPGDPANDWELTANDTANGGQSYLGVTDRTAGTLPLRVLEGGPADVLALAPGGLARLAHGTLVQRVNGSATENPSGFDAGALLTALGTLPVSTYHLAGDPSPARHIGPTGAAFNAAFGLGSGADVALGDLTGVALAAAKELAQRVAASPPGQAGPAGERGSTGPAGAPAAADADHAPPAAALAAFRARLDRLARGETEVRRRTAALRKRIEAMR